MFATLVTASKSRVTIALAGAVTTTLACREIGKEKKISKEMHGKLLMEQAKVTQLQAELQAVRTVQAHAEEANTSQKEVLRSQKDMKGILTTSTLLNAVLGISILGAVLNGKHPRTDF